MAYEDYQAQNPDAMWNPSENFGGRGIDANQQSYLGRHDALIFDPNENVQTKQQKYLQNMAYYGGGPSQAQVVLQQGLGQALAQTQALAASQRGISPALAARYAAQQQSQLSHHANISATMLRSQEQMQALQMLQGTAQGEQNFDMARMQGQQQADAQHRGLNQQLLSGALQGAAMGATYGAMAPGAAGATGTAAAAGGGATEHYVIDSEGMGQGGVGGGGGLTPRFNGYASGGAVPGKAQVDGNDPKNDKVHAMLSPGEIVLPRSVTQSPDMEKKALEFLRSLKSKKGGYEKVASAKKMNCGGKV